MKGELHFEGVFGKVLKKVFRTKRDELTGGWVKIANNFYSSSNTIRLFQFRKLIVVGCVTQFAAV
jgi:hypothetical protein